VIDQPQLDALQRILFAGLAARPERRHDGNGAAPVHAVYAVLDGCMVKQLPTRLHESGCEYSCLFSGRLDPALEAAAPYLVRLDPQAAFTRSVLREGWNDHWGIVLQAPAQTDLYAVRHHLRRFLRVTGPGGRAMFFRFYDPRAFRVTIPGMRRADYREFIGPLLGIYTEGRSVDTLLHFAADGAPQGKALPLAHAGPAPAAPIHAASIQAASTQTTPTRD
jgi:hypothetical protein